MLSSYSPFSLSIRFIRLMEIKMITARIMEMALPKFQSPTEINWDSIRFPISMYCPPPRSFGITKEGIKVIGIGKITKNYLEVQILR